MGPELRKFMRLLSEALMIVIQKPQVAMVCVCFRSDGALRSFAWHPHTDKFAVALLDDSIKIYKSHRYSSAHTQLSQHRYYTGIHIPRQQHSLGPDPVHVDSARPRCGPDLARDYVADWVPMTDHHTP